MIISFGTEPLTYSAAMAAEVICIIYIYIPVLMTLKYSVSLPNWSKILLFVDKYFIW